MFKAPSPCPLPEGEGSKTTSPPFFLMVMRADSMQRFSRPVRVSSSGMSSVSSVLNRAYHVDEGRSWVRVRVISIGLTVALAVFVVCATSVAWLRPVGAAIAGAFIALVLVLSILTRAWRSTEFRLEAFEFADKLSEHEWERLKASDLPILVPIRAGLKDLRDAQGKIAKVSEVRDNRWTIRSNNSLQKAPLGEQSRTLFVYEVAPMHITRDQISVDEQDSVALASKQHCSGGTRATGANYDRVVHLTS